MVDSSVWINYFNGSDTLATQKLDALLGITPVCTGDLILVEVLQGFRQDKDYQSAKTVLCALPVHAMLGKVLCIKSADNFRVLRQRGITVRKSTDVIIATYCIENDLPLLFDDKDFRPFQAHLGLQTLT